MINKQNTGNVGLFYACYCLSLHGWNAMPTIRNAKGADILIFSEEGKKFGVQVKALSARNDVILGKDYIHSPTVDFWVVLMDVRLDSPKAYIIPAQDITDGVEACRSGIDSKGKLVTNDLPKPDGSMACLSV